MTFEMKLYHNAFLAIAFGAKTVEMRLFDNKRRQIKVGDIIDFTDVVTAQKLSCKVIDIAVYDNFEQLYEYYDKVSLGYASGQTALASDMLEYYSPIDIDRNGVVAITIKSSNVITNIGGSMKKLGFGMMRLPLCEYQQFGGIDIEQVKVMVDDFLEKGFVYFDTAYPYHNGMSELVFAETVAKRYSRDKYILADKLPIFRIDNREQAPKYFAEQLQKCGVEYFDYYLLHAMNASRCVTCEANGIFDFVVEQKRLNKIKHLGFSFHDSSKVLDDILTRHPEIEFVQLQINYIDWHDNNIDSKACYEVACKHNKPIIVMEPVKGGSLVNLPTSAKQLLTTHSDMSVASWAVRYCASLDNCFMVLSGMSDIRQMSDNISYMTDFVPLNPNEREVIEKVVSIISQCATIPCTNCKYCVADCPRQIDIPRMFALYNKQSRFPDTDIAELVSQYYSIIGNTASAKSCIVCKQCEQLCPQHIDITRWLQIIAAQFEK